jgi:hypothetical protein
VGAAAVTGLRELLLGVCVVRLSIALLLPNISWIRRAGAFITVDDEVDWLELNRLVVVVVIGLLLL